MEAIEWSSVSVKYSLIFITSNYMFVATTKIVALNIGVAMKSGSIRVISKPHDHLIDISGLRLYLIFV